MLLSRCEWKQPTRGGVNDPVDPKRLGQVGAAVDIGDFGCRRLGLVSFRGRRIQGIKTPALARSKE